jgi:hypothetical protein
MAIRPERLLGPDILFEYCKITDLRYKAIRDRHYVPNRGTYGLQLHFLIWYRKTIVGIISGASSVYDCSPRDEFFKLPKDKKSKEKALVHIVNNVVFRLEPPESIRVETPDLAPRCLALWRKIISFVWLDLYGAPVRGFETFVKEEVLEDGSLRTGKAYIADNWIPVGYSQGSAKHRRGIESKHTRVETTPKKIFVRRNDDAPLEYKLWAKGWLPPHKPSWQRQTLEEKARKAGRDAKRKYLLGRLFSYTGGEVYRTNEDGSELALAGPEIVAEEAAARYITKSRRRATFRTAQSK